MDGVAGTGLVSNTGGKNCLKIAGLADARQTEVVEDVIVDDDALR